MSAPTNPSLSRSQNLLVIAPPAPAYAGAILGRLVEQQQGEGSLMLVLAPPASLGEWSALLPSLPTLTRAVVASGVRQATRALKATPGPGVLIVSPLTAIGLREKSVLDPARISAVLAAWPETWEDAESLTVVLQDVAREAARVIVTSDAGAIQGVVERHAWRPATSGETGLPVMPAGPVRTVPVAWGRRIAAVQELIERLDPASLAIWTAGDSHHAELKAAVAGAAVPVTISSGELGAADQVIVFDPPSAADLARLLAAGNVTILVPPGTEAWVARIAAPRTPLLLSATLDAADADLARRRAAIDRAVRDAALWPGMLALGPLFERHDPASVAAALYGLWAAEPRKQAALAEGPEPGATVKIWVGAGRRDQIAVSDIVGMLTNEVKIDRASIGKVDLRESFSLIEVPVAAAERIASAIGGRTLRGRRLTARVDRKGPA
ncbi:MAG TPA: DbpA RNA binding domain-containing protein [Gemmatimonadales bacterium]|nr:DbpA RNA binding domain-containing protein [Gemmatimonadales bacterium]